MTEPHKEAESQPLVIRRAKLLLKVREEISIDIEDGELIVGRAKGKRVGCPLLPEVQWQ